MKLFRYLYFSLFMLLCSASAMISEQNILCEYCFLLNGWTNQCMNSDACKSAKQQGCNIAIGTPSENSIKEPNQLNTLCANDKSDVAQSLLNDRYNKLKQIKDQKLKEERAAFQRAKERASKFKTIEAKRNQVEIEQQKKFETTNQQLKQIDKKLLEKILDGKIDIEKASKSEGLLKNKDVADLIKIIKDSRDNFKKITQTEKQKKDAEIKKAAEIAKDLINSFENDSTNAKDFYKNQNRIKNIADGIDNLDKADNTFNKTSFTPVTDGEAKALKDLSGETLNKLQNSIKNEFIATLSDVSTLNSHFIDNFNVRSLTEAACEIASAGSQSIKNKNYNEAYSLSNISEKIVDVTRSTANYVASVYDNTLSNIANGFHEGSQLFDGAKNHLMVNLKNYNEYLQTCPPDVPQDMLIALIGAKGIDAVMTAASDTCKIGELGANVLREPIENSKKLWDCTKVAGAFIAKETLKMITNPEEFKLDTLKVVTKAETIIKNEYDKSSGEICIDLLESTVWFASSGKIFSTLTSGGYKAISSLNRLARQEAIASTMAACCDGQKIIMPITNSMREASNTIEAAQKIGCCSALHALELIESVAQDPQLQNLNNVIKLFEEASSTFAERPGFCSCISDKISQAGKDGIVGTVKGSMYEVEIGLHLENSGETVLRFGREASLKDSAGKILTSAREFDIETPTKFIECKNIIWDSISAKKTSDLKTTFALQNQIAKQLGKVFPENMKSFFNKHGIKFIEGK